MIITNATVKACRGRVDSMLIRMIAVRVSALDCGANEIFSRTFAPPMIVSSEARLFVCVM